MSMRRAVASKSKQATARIEPGIGAVPLAHGGVRFRVWAPKRSRVEVLLETLGRGRKKGASRALPLNAEGAGYFSGVVPEARAGDRYRYRLDGQDTYPDPASRFQPEGPFGPSLVVDPTRFVWRDGDWPGPSLSGQVIYEMHVGTFTEKGTWQAAAWRLPALADLGISVLEIMPVAEFPGRFNWGYDGVDLFAPSHLYGAPDDFRAFVDQAHRLGIGVLLDVVYNHVGPRGDFLAAFSDTYKNHGEPTEWGAGFNFDGPGSEGVRAFFLANVAYWIREFHLDGLRFDALQEFRDASDEPIVVALADCAREAAAGRSILLIGENEPQQSRMLRPASLGGFGLDALWNDDFHHVAVNALTRRVAAYYGDYHGSPQEFVSLWKHGYLYQGQTNVRQGKPRGQPTRGVALRSFVNYLENHDQVANSLQGERLHHSTSPALHRAMIALLLLAPGTPMLFQGQELSSPPPFSYFNDAGPDDRDQVRESRREFLAQFPSLATEEAQRAMPDPTDVETFLRAKLKDEAPAAISRIYILHRDLIRLRRSDPVFRLQGSLGVDGAVLGPEAFVLRHYGDNGDDRIILVNLGGDFVYTPISEPLLAPPEGQGWQTLWSSESVDYGGDGTPEPQGEAGWQLPRQSTVVLRAVYRDEENVS